MTNKSKVKKKLTTFHNQLWILAFPTRIPAIPFDGVDFSTDW